MHPIKIMSQHIKSIKKLSAVNKCYDEILEMHTETKEQINIVNNLKYQALLDYKQIFWSPLTNPDDKVKIVLELVSKYPDEGMDLFVSVRDGLKYMKSATDTQIVKNMILQLCRNELINAHTIYITASMLFETN